MKLIKWSGILLIIALLLATVKPVAAVDVYLPLLRTAAKPIIGTPQPVAATVKALFANGDEPSIAIGTDGNPIVSLNDRTCSVQATCFRVIQCLDATCADFSVGPVLGTGWSTKIMIGADDLPILSYNSFTTFDPEESKNTVNVAHCTDSACSKVVTSTVFTSLDYVVADMAIGGDGLPIIATNGTFIDKGLPVIHCEDVRCSKTTTTILDGEFYSNSYTSLAIGADGLPIIAYSDGLEIYYVKCDDPTCAAFSRNIIARGGPHYTPSIVVGADGLPLIPYHQVVYSTRTSSSQSGVQTCAGAPCPNLIIDPDPEGNLNVAHCEDLRCTQVTTTILDGEGLVGLQNTVMLGADGLPFIAYAQYEPVFDLKFAHCENSACTSATVAEWNNPYGYPAVALGRDNLPLIAFSDFSGVSVAHCDNAKCAAP